MKNATKIFRMLFGGGVLVVLVFWGVTFLMAKKPAMPVTFDEQRDEANRQADVMSQLHASQKRDLLETMDGKIAFISNHPYPNDLALCWSVYNCKISPGYSIPQMGGWAKKVIRRTDDDWPDAIDKFLSQ